MDTGNTTGSPTLTRTTANPAGSSGSRKPWRFLTAHPAAWIVLALSLAASAAGWFIARNNALLTARNRFDEETYRTEAALAERILIYQNVLHGAVGLFASSYSVEREEWKAYIDSVSIDRRFPGIDGVGYIAFVHRTNLERFIIATRADKTPDFKVTTSGNADADLLVIKYLEPQDRHGSLVGLDLAGDSKRFAAAELARDTGDPVITGGLVLEGKAARDESGFLMLLPVYKNRLPHATLEERRANIEGWVYARFVTSQLLQGILANRSGAIDFSIVDVTPGGPGEILFENGAKVSDAEPMFTREIPFSTGHRRWQLVFHTNPGFSSTISRTAPALTAAAGVLLSLMLFGIVWSLSTTRERAVSMASDMTAELRSVNERLEYEKYLLKALMDNVPDRIYFKDREHRFLRNNRAHLECFGFTDQAQALGKRDSDFFAAEHAAEAYEDEEEILRTGRPVTKEEKETWPDGSVTWVLTTKMPLRDHENRIVGTFGISRNITERKHAEEALLRAKEAAEEANRTKSQFLASMSHELRTPLNSIIGFANILLKNRSGAIGAADLNFLDRIQANGKHLLGLINEILDLSKIEAHKLELRMSPVRLDQLVRDTLSQEEGLVKDKPVELLADLPPRVEPMLTDADKLKQVLINLIGNALKFTERGSVTVRLLTDPADHQPVRLEVADTGIGIENDKLGMIFEAFQQAEAGTARKYGGTGLGLTISQALCRLMGYNIEAISEVGKGSTFSIVFRPGTSSRESHTEFLARTPRKSPAAEPATAQMRGTIVLVIDDEADSRALVTHTIEEVGCHVISSDSGELGLLMAKKLKPHLITTDLLMPGMDGWQVLRALKSDPELRSIPVIVISVVAGENRGRIFGAVEILQKPVERADLVAALKRCLLPPSPSVLIVDDDEDARRLMSTWLSDHGRQIRTATNGRQALEMIQDSAPDVVVLDLMMPVMDGIAFLNAIRADARYQHLPVLVVTSKDLTQSETEYLRQETLAVTKKAGAFEEDLKRLIQKLLSDKEHRSAAVKKD